MKNVTIYSTPTCHYCGEAKNFFTANNVQYEEVDVASNAERRAEMVEKSGQLGVPVIDIGGEIIVGFDEPRIRASLGL